MNSENHSVLIVDDDPEVRKLMADVLEDEGYVTFVAANEQEAFSQMKKRVPDVVFLDLWIGEEESAGIKILGKIKKIKDEIPVIIISGHGTIDVAIQVIRNGAFDFIEKPFVIDRLLITCQRAIEMYKLKRENLYLKNNRLHSEIFGIGASPFACSIRSTIEKIAASNSRVFLDSPTGMEADVVAYNIHKKSARKEYNFVYVNCISDNPENFADDLFGTEKSYGRLERANGGTIFLEEINKLPKELQRKFLSFLLEEKYFCGNRVVYSDARVICSATGENMRMAIENDLFSQELFYRLKISEIIIPPLKNRREDIVPIIEYYLARSERLFGLPSKKFTENALVILQSYDWPGNIHQIKNVVESSLINARDSADVYMDENVLPPELTTSTKDKFDSLNIAKFITLPLKEAKENFECDYLRAQVERFSGNISQTANFIGMERSALHRKMKALHLENRKIPKSKK
ncbi:MAG: sigma-54 dependent transcriptional regulator [Holosporaceae bacterium]|jgi:two-component system nitrogen regulation response regulator NtrX|nr:sigma-54 dependent transcriptional regulator [Holosporaceae bacterium]